MLLDKLMRQIEAEFGRRLSIPQVFLAPDVRRMTALPASAPRDDSIGTDQSFLGLIGDRLALLKRELKLPEIAAE